MNTAAITTPPKVSNFLRQMAQHQNAPVAMPAPPNHRCPKCGNLLEPDEIADQTCWSCLSPLSADTDTEEDD